MRPGWRRALRTPLILLGVNLVVAALAAGVLYGYTDSQESLRNRLAGAMRNLNYQRASVADDIAYLDANRAEYDALSNADWSAIRIGSRRPSCSSS
jgi:hypothetical protein